MHDFKKSKSCGDWDSMDDDTLDLGFIRQFLVEIHQVTFMTV